MYKLCTICLEFRFWIVPKRIKLIRLMNHHDFWTWRHCCFLTSEYLSYQHGDNIEVYVETFLTIVKGFQPLIFNTKRSILDFASVLDPSLNTIERFSTALFRVTCIFKYFEFVDRSNLQTVTNEFLTDRNAVFM